MKQSDGSRVAAAAGAPGSLYTLTSRAERLLLWLLALTQFTVIMDFMIMMPLGPQVMGAFSIGPSAFAAAVSVYSWCAGLSGLFAATYVDRFNRRSLLLTMYGLFLLSNLGCALAGSFHFLLIARAVVGLSGGVIGSVIMAIVGDVIPAPRRGAATGTIMSAFALASVIGVPAGILLGAHFSWTAPFFLLFAMSLLIAVSGCFVLPTLNAHLKEKRPAWRQALPQLWQLVVNPNHRNAFTLTFILMLSSMLIIPFLSPVLVANHGVAPKNLAWLYMAGGLAPLFLMRYIGRLSDQYGHKRVFRTMVFISMIVIFLFTHLPTVPLLALLLLFPFFMMAMSGRIVPLQALLTAIPAPSKRGAFLSVNSSFQSLGSGCGAWLGGLLLSKESNGFILGYGVNGWFAIGLAFAAVAWVGRISPDRPEGATLAVPNR